MTAQEEREKSRQIGPLRGLLPYVLRYKWMAVGAGLALCVTAMLSLSLPLAVRRVIDNFGAESAAQMDRYFGAAILIAGLLAIGTAVRFMLVTRLGERVVADIRRAMFDRIISMSPAFYERVMTGEILSRLTTDTTLILSVIGSSVSVALRHMLTLTGGLIFMLLTSAKLTGLVMLGVPLVLVPILTLGRRLRVLSRESQDAIAASSAHASELLQAAQTVQSYTREGTSRARFGDLTEYSFDVAKRRITTRAGMTAIVIFLVFTSVVAVLWIGARDVRAGEMSAGELVQFVIYSVMVAGAVGAVSEIWGELQRAAGATERIMELLETQDSLPDPVDPLPLVHPVRGEIRFDDVAFSYPSRPDVSALEGVSFAIAPGETVALVGPSGAGKSTVLQLLQRFYAPQGGEITLDGVGLHRLTRTDLRSALALVPQDPVIFATTIAENIGFGREGASRDEIIAAATAASAHEFIMRLPEGYDSYVGERGVMLSGGQKQRIAIARAVLRDAPVLLLDEATSALDAESERAVQEAFDRMSADRTTLIVAHRLATVKKADRILVFDEGRIVAQGTHDSLVSEGGLYARLAALQFTST
ncbi:ABC transporter transmembrane domain-containing protein [Paracoccaceae bacterium GXU_MW_L88]